MVTSITITTTSITTTNTTTTTTSFTITPTTTTTATKLRRTNEGLEVLVAPEELERLFDGSAGSAALLRERAEHVTLVTHGLLQVAVHHERLFTVVLALHQRHGLDFLCVGMI